MDEYSDVLEEIVRRIVAYANPDKIILFGSVARGVSGPDSDIDLLVIKTGVRHRRELAQKIHRQLFGIGRPVDILVQTPQDIESSRSAVGSILPTVLSEGREIYAL